MRLQYFRLLYFLLNFVTNIFHDKSVLVLKLILAHTILIRLIIY